MSASKGGSISTSKTLTLRASDALVLACGKAAITLNRDGTIIIDGTNVLTAAEGHAVIRANRIDLN